jgi:hypothetical protein
MIVPRDRVVKECVSCGQRTPWRDIADRQRIAASSSMHLLNHRTRINMDQAQLIQAAASIAGGMAAAHYDKFSGLVATRITDIAETAVKIARAIDAEARKQQ